MRDIEPFHIAVPEAELVDLAERLERVRLPEPETVVDGSQGLELKRLQDLLDTWHDHDWRELEQRCNEIPHFRARIDGLQIAFWHVRSPEPDALPLLLTHGWPGSVLEFEQLLGPLSDPVAHGGSAQDAFHVVVPSLPGFGFTDRPSEPGWHPGRTAGAFAELMSRLGYVRFGAHGGGWGAYISTELAIRHPSRLAGLHLTTPIASPLPADRATATPAERRMIDQRAAHLAHTHGHGHGKPIGARPQTLGYGLVDSPAGLAAWLGEKFAAYAGPRPTGVRSSGTCSTGTCSTGTCSTGTCSTDTCSTGTRHEVGAGVCLRQQVEAISLYWMTATGASSCRWHWEALRWTARRAESDHTRPVTVPTACTLFPADPWPTAHRWAQRRYTDLRSWNQPDHGGHFPGLEHPDLLIRELRDAFRALR
jgi:pimeloyl-ACP methyl ester carboxylesterase